MNNYDTVSTMFDKVAQANPERHRSNLERRVLKLVEELGEHAEAFLNVTSTTNHKGKSAEDVKEEAVDILIVAIDVALTPLNDTEQQDDLRQRFDSYVRRWLHHINMSHYSIMLRILGNLARFGETFVGDEQTVQYYRAEIVRYAVALVSLMFKGNDAAIIAEVTRKLAKWTRCREKDSCQAQVSN